MEVKPDYKQTEVGVIPEDWQVAQIGELKPFVTSGSRGWASYYSDRGSLFVRITNLSRDTIYLDLKDSKFVNLPPDANEGTRTQLQEHDVLISITADIGIVGYVDSRVPTPAYINQHIALVRFDPTKTSGKFVSYFLASEKPQKLFRASTDVGAKAGMSLLTVQKLQLALPSHPEQRAIAGALSDVDALIGALDQLIAKKRDLKQAAMQQLLTGKIRLPGFDSGKLEYRQTEVGEIPEDWAVVEVKEVTRGHKQGYYTKDRYVERGVKLVRITDLMNPRIDYPAMPMLNISKSDHDLYKVKVGDFLFARSGAIGRYGIVYEDAEAVFGSYIIRFSFNPNQLSNEYFGFLYETQILWKQLLSITQGSSNININAANIKSIRIPLPSIVEQTAIAEVLSDMDAELAALEQRRDKTRALKQGMMQELLTGRTRLV